MTTIVVSNRTKEKITLKSFDGDSIDIQPMAKRIRIDDKFNWNLPRGVVLEKPVAEVETEVDPQKLKLMRRDVAGNPGAAVAMKMAAQNKSNPNVNQNPNINQNPNPGAEVQQNAPSLQMEHARTRVGSGPTISTPSHSQSTPNVSVKRQG